MRLSKVFLIIINGLILFLLCALVAFFKQQIKVRSFYVQKVLVPNNKNIFFIETSCVNKTNIIPDGLHLTSRQACAVYSTAKMNPSRPVILYHSCPLHPNYYERSSEGNKHLLKLPNVFVVYLNYDDILRGSLVENILDDIKSSPYLRIHASDTLRLVLLYKYGGAYMDLDFISIRSLDSLPKNVISPQATTELCNAFLQFDFKGKGNEFVKEILTNLSKNYIKDSWSKSGQELIEKIYFKFCSVTKLAPFRKVTSNQCEISLCNITTFYPIYWKNWRLLFSPMNTKFVMKILNNAIAVHFWNHMSKNEKIKIGEGTTYEILARRHCPVIFESAGDSF